MFRYLNTALSIIFMLTAVCAPAQESGTSYSTPKQFFNIGFVNSTLKQENFPDLKCDWGATINWGRSYFLHKPIAGRLRFSIDAVWTDLTYSNYKIEMTRHAGYTDRYQIHTGDIGVGVGAGMHYSFNNRVSARFYARYNPCLSLIYNDYGELDDESVRASFGNFGVVGIAARYRIIGAGAECRFGRVKYKSFVNRLFGDDEYDDFYDREDQDGSHMGTTDKNGRIKSDIMSWRFFISLTF